MSGPGAALPHKQREEFLLKNPVCIACGVEEDLSIDHIVPRSKGGGDEKTNLQTLCHYCNTQKGTKSQEEWWRYWADRPRPSVAEILER